MSEASSKWPDDWLVRTLEAIASQMKFSGQTTQANINGATVRAHKVPLPSNGEQFTISLILDILDTAIHQTEAIIAKLKAVKPSQYHGRGPLMV